MKFKITYYHAAAVLFSILISGIPACQKEQPKESSTITIPGESGPDTRIADLLASMNMHHFANPVQAPHFELDSLQGEKVSLVQHRGKVVFLSFWATW